MWLCGMLWLRKKPHNSWLYYCSGSSEFTAYVGFSHVQWSQANVIEGAPGWQTSSSYKSSGSSFSSSSGKYVGNGRFLQKSLYAGSTESLIWGGGGSKDLINKLFKDSLVYLFIILEYLFLHFVYFFFVFGFYIF